MNTRLYISNMNKRINLLTSLKCNKGGITSKEYHDVGKNLATLHTWKYRLTRYLVNGSLINWRNKVIYTESEINNIITKLLKTTDEFLITIAKGDNDHAK